MGRLALVGGGARSGKSAFALSLARRSGGRLGYLATATAVDGEMRERIARHRAERGDAFATIEEAVDAPGALAQHAELDAIVVDCLTLWMSSLLARDASPDEILARVDDAIAAAARRDGATIFVTNEVGMGIVPDNALARAFRDVSGFAHQRISDAADEMYWAVLGTILRIKPSDLAVDRR